MSDTTLEQQIALAARSAVLEAVKKLLTERYDSPLHRLTARVVDERSGELERLLTAGFDAVIGEPGFGEEIKAALRAKLSRTLVSKLGGEIEKRINDLRANPATRARMTVALEKAVDEVLSDD